MFILFGPRPSVLWVLAPGAIEFGTPELDED